MIKPIRIEGNVAYVALNDGREAVIDATDAARIGQFNWFANPWDRGFYAMRRDWQKGQGFSIPILMHRVILNASVGLQVDHINSDGLDNRRANLRLATAKQNAANSRIKTTNRSGLKCVHWSNERNKWRVQIVDDGKRIHGGYFADKATAEAVAKNLIQSIHGEFARVS